MPVAIDGRARWTRILLVAVLVLDVVAVVSDLAEYRLLGTDFTQDQADANDTRQAVVGALQVALFVVTVIAFVSWFHGAYRNVEPLGGKRRWGEGWAIGAWFVPILNLWRPKQLANDILRGTEPAGTDARDSALLAFWWGAFLVSSWTSQIAGRISLGADTVDELRTASVLYTVGDALDIAAAALAVAVVGTLTARQREQARQRAEAQPAAT